MSSDSKVIMFQPKRRATTQDSRTHEKKSAREHSHAESSTATAHIQADATDKRHSAIRDAEKRAKFKLPELRLPEEGTRRRILVALACVIVAVVMLYGPTRNLYVAHRDEQILTARLERLNAQNDELIGRLSAVQTREGIVDEARRRGYVEYGETSVAVEGLDLDDETRAEVVSLTQEVDEMADRPFYITILDFLFQYKPSV